MRSDPSVTRTLAETLVDVMWYIEGTDEEQMNPDDAVKVLENAAASLGGLPQGRRAELVELLGTMAQEESDPERREFLEEFPESFGLVNDADA
ncbi:hypothetical protein G5C51_03350 [Streptomyces sp. A7024]|uniref:Uncharacterized protein n=1 Tax=Streptomyces coryli TaxID=1128680 RepID=A0A6G4TVB6_9ACTN|nr:hypothetical protein [Streptomyces coryli]NGN62941.1 hypothetical protein [Streptomyces coryli]